MDTRTTKAGILAALLAWPIAGNAAQAPPIPERAESDTLEQVPAPWRDYLIRVRAAERIADPLERCLAFPDLPGNRWPEGHATDHCRHHFAYPRPTMAEIAALIDAGKVVELEARLGARLQRHFDEREPGEDIHDVFNYGLFEPDAESDRVTAKWLELAPQSAFAHLARGRFLSRSAWVARGSKFAAETPRENMRRMSELVEQAIPFLEKAISLDPKLMPAYTELHGLAMVDSRADLEAGVFERARKIDPACVELANVRMRALEPRWGGDYEQMLGYANELSRQLARRPQLAIHMAAPYGDLGDTLIASDQYTRSTLEVLEAAVSIGSNEDALRDAADVALNTTDAEPDGWKGLAYLLQESRFRQSNAWGQRQIAWALVRAEPEWSLRYALSAIALEPDNAFGHYLAGAGYYNMRQYDAADREYAIAIENQDQRQASLREVSEMWLVSGDDRVGAAKAKPYIDRLLREYPDDGRGWLLDLRRRMVSGAVVDADAIKAVLKKVDRTDPWQAPKAKGLDGLLRRLEAPTRKHP